MSYSKDENEINESNSKYWDKNNNSEINFIFIQTPTFSLF